MASSAPVSPHSPRPYSLIRSRSFLVPGVATRETTNPLLRKHPMSPPIPEEQQSWNPGMFGQSPLSKLAGWESKNDGLSERAITPELDHYFLGSHALGSLRITNGDVSATPTIASKVLCHSTEVPGLSGTGPLNPSSNPIRPRAPSPAVSSSTQYTLREEPCNNPARDFPLARTATVLKPYLHEAGSNPFIDKLFDDVDEDNDQVDNEYESYLGAGSAPTVLYQAEMNSNPFLPLENDNLSESQAMDSYDILPEVTVAETSLNNAGAVEQPHAGRNTNARRRRDVNKHSTSVEYRADTFVQDEMHLLKTDGLPSAASSIYSTVSHKQNPRPKHYSTFDSGYGSQRSSQGSRETLILEEKQEQPAVTYREDIDNASPVNRSSIQNANTPMSTPRKSLNTDKPLPSDPPKSGSMGSDKKTRRRSFPNFWTTESSCMAESPTKSPKSKAKPNKLQKKRPKSHSQSSEPIVVQSQPFSNQSLGKVPDVPSEVATRYSQRMIEHPKMDHLERTYKSVAHEGSRESVSSVEPFNVPIRFPSPNRSIEEQESRNSPRVTRRSSFTPEHIQSFFRRSVGRSKTEANNFRTDDSPMGISDFGTVSNSLGASPYDTAVSTSPSEMRGRSAMPSKPTSAPYIHPQRRRPKSAIGMTDEMASRVAVQRSRDRRKPNDYNDGFRTEFYKQSSNVRSTPHLEPDVRDRLPCSTGSPSPKERPYPRPRSADANRAIAPVERTQFSNNDWHNRDSRPGRAMTAEFPYHTGQSDRRSRGNTHAEIEWADSARAWRTRRKSMGENLRANPWFEPNVDASRGDSNWGFEGAQNANRRHLPAKHAFAGSSSPTKYSDFGNGNSGGRRPTQRLPETTRHIPRNRNPQVRAPSPTPSVRERAAAYERRMYDRGIMEPPVSRQRMGIPPPKGFSSGANAGMRKGGPLSRVSIPDPSMGSPFDVISAYASGGRAAAHTSAVSAADFPSKLMQPSPTRKSYPTVQANR